MGLVIVLLTTPPGCLARFACPTPLSPPGRKGRPLRFVFVVKSTSGAQAAAARRPVGQGPDCPVAQQAEADEPVAELARQFA
jgi:hypothetical protein